MTGKLIKVKFGKPAKKPEALSRSKELDQATFRRYFCAFFDPKLNPYINDMAYQGHDFEANLKAYIQTNLSQIVTSNIPAKTCNSRAAVILHLDKESLLNCLQDFVAGKLDAVDVKALTILFHQDNFILKTGQYIYEKRKTYGINLKPSDAVATNTPQQLTEAAIEKVRTHLKICGYCSYKSDAMGELIDMVGDIFAPNISEKQAAFRRRFLNQSWTIRQKVESFSRFALSDPLEICAVADYLAKVSIIETGTRNYGWAIDFILSADPTKIPTWDSLK